MGSLFEKLQGLITGQPVRLNKNPLWDAAIKQVLENHLGDGWESKATRTTDTHYWGYSWDEHRWSNLKLGNKEVSYGPMQDWRFGIATLVDGEFANTKSAGDIVEPARLELYSDGKVAQREFREKGEPHNPSPTQPAIEEFWPSGILSRAESYVHGTFINPPSGHPAALYFNDGGTLVNAVGCKDGFNVAAVPVEEIIELSRRQVCNALCDGDAETIALQGSCSGQPKTTSNNRSLPSPHKQQIIV